MSTARTLRVNPVLEREMRERMRGPRAVVVLTLYLGVLIGIFYIVFRTYTDTRFGTRNAVTPTDVARIGRSTFEWVLFFMLLLVFFLVPGLTSGAVAGERERQTLVPMQITLLRPWSIVFGKVSASLSFLILLILATTPLLALSYLIGGVSLAQVVKGLFGVLFTGLVLACLTVACSAAVRRTQSATVLAYGMMLLLTVGTFVVYGGASVLVALNNSSDRAPAAPLYLNPVVLTSSLIATDQDSAPQGFGMFVSSSRTSSPFEGTREMMRPRSNTRFAAVAQPINGGLAPDVAFVNGQIAAPPAQNVQVQSAGFDAFTGLSLLSLTALGLLCAWRASRRLRTPAEIER